MTRYTASTFVALIAMGASTLCAKSIFDDDAPSAPAPVHETARPPVKTEPEETPPPTPAAPADTPPAPNTSPAPNTPETAPPIIADAATIEKEARAKAELELATAKAAAEKRVNADADYVKARDAVDDARNAYEETKRNGSIEEKTAAFNTLSQALTNKETLYTRMVDGDKAYQEARKNAAKYAGAAPVAVAQKEVVSPEIAEAIANHDFVAGMTLRQARKAARLQCECVRVDGSTKTYRWYVKGRTGTFTTTSERANGKVTLRTVADFGIVGYVEGNFVDDKLTTFGRYSLAKKTKTTR
ncbi:MAG TPA: hypothetical protein VG326_11645 [Tepidisphaeraceae bacterium]|nr:hypothetical protein [Tepidisphaeraceae bacterium]